ncbi:MAG TPA: MMPL family transporter [Candidatus Dormibacteraeota bacterium]|nr:MMPL family transporter [Candidatus Dormibacteraeota bacterium]
MLFTRLARAIIRHNKAVFAIWLAALVVSIPAILQVQSVIVYNETAFNPKNSESSIAQDLVGREFSIDQGTSAIVVITANDVRGNSVRDFALALNRTLHNDGKLSDISNVTSIYDIYYRQLVDYTNILHPQLYQTKNATALATSIEFGIPTAYVNDWTSLVGSAPPSINQTQLVALNQQAYNTSWPIISAQNPPPYQSVALNYLTLFYQSWNQTFTGQNYSQFQLLIGSPPFERAQNVTKGSPLLAIQPSYYNITVPFIQSQLLDPATRNLFLSAALFFNLYSGQGSGTCSNNNCWNDQNAIRSFTIDTVAQATSANSGQKTVLGEIYDLGASATSTDLAGLSQQVLRNFNILTYPVQPTGSVYSQFVAGQNDTMLMIIDFKSGGPDPLNSIPEIRQDVGLANTVSNQRLVVYITGAPAFNYDIQTQTVMDVERIDPVTITLILVIVGFFFASLVAPLIPLVAIGLSIGIAFGLVFAVGSVVTKVHYLVLTLLPVSMLGAGSDYCIFLVSRYSEERKMGRGKKDSVERAVTWAGESIATSGATVIIAFGTLAFASFGLLRSIGIAVMLGISVALLVALTLVPAALSTFGDRIFWPRGLGPRKKKRNSENSYYARAARFTGKHSKLVLLLALAVSLPAASTVLTSKTSHDLISQIPTSLESRAGYNIVSQGFGAGTVTPTYTIVQTPVVLLSGNWINVTALKAISYAENSTLAIPGVSKVYGLTHPSGDPIPFTSFSQLSLPQQQAMILSMKPFLGSDGKSAMVWANLSNEPYSDAAIATVSRIRDNVGILKSQDPLLASSSMYVGGATASVSDLTRSSGSDFLNLTTLVLVGVFIVLLVALGSVFTPLRLIFTILLSIAWAMAATVYFFRTYFATDLIWILPIMLVVIMVGLGLDYDIFLVTRIREYVAGGAREDEAIETAVERTGGIITVTGLVTAGAYGTMMLSQIPMLQQLGLAIFIVVLLDATLTRIYLVPSIMRMMKRLNWWAPTFLRRVPTTPEEKLIPPMPMRTKLAVIVETASIIGLVTVIYLDYANNVYLQEYLSRTVPAVLSGINLWTGVILAVTSFLATYFIMRGKTKPGTPASDGGLKRLAGKLDSPKTVSKIGSLVPSASPSLQTATLNTLPTVPDAKTAGEISAPAVSETKEKD